MNPTNKRKFTVIVVGSGLAGASAAALGELGYNVKVFCFQDTCAARTHRGPGRYQRRQELPQNDGDSVLPPTVLRHCGRVATSRS